LRNCSSGHRREIMAVIPDSYGREVYEVYRFAGLKGAVLANRADHREGLSAPMRLQ
jgi:hypothetical protein